MARPPAQRRTSLALAFFRQAETDYRDSLLLAERGGHPCNILMLLRSASEKAVKAFLALRYTTRAFFDRLKELSHQPIRLSPLAQGLIKSTIAPGALQVLLELEAMQPGLAPPTTANPQYPWLVGLTTEVEHPARFFSKADVKRFISPVHRLLGAVRTKLPRNPSTRGPAFVGFPKETPCSQGRSMSRFMTIGHGLLAVLPKRSPCPRLPPRSMLRASGCERRSPLSSSPTLRRQER